MYIFPLSARLSFFFHSPLLVLVLSFWIDTECRPVNRKVLSRLFTLCHFLFLNDACEPPLFFCFPRFFSLSVLRSVWRLFSGCGSVSGGPAECADPEDGTRRTCRSHSKRTVNCQKWSAVWDQFQSFIEFVAADQRYSRLTLKSGELLMNN